MARRTLTITDQDKAEMLRVYVSERKGLVEIGKQYGISPSTVSRLLTVQGATMRPRGTRPSKEKEVLVNPLESHTPDVTAQSDPFFMGENNENFTQEEDGPVIAFTNEEEEPLDFSIPSR